MRGRRCGKRVTDLVDVLWSAPEGFYSMVKLALRNTVLRRSVTCTSRR